MIIENGNMTSIFHLVPDCSYHVEPMTIHRVEAIEDTTLVEVSTPKQKTWCESRMIMGELLEVHDYTAS